MIDLLIAGFVGFVIGIIFGIALIVVIAMSIGDKKND